MTLLDRRGSYVVATNGTTWASTNLCIDGTYGNNDATYGTWTNATRNASGYIEIGVFNFSDIPSDATINSVTVTIRHYESNTTYINGVTFQPFDDATAIGSPYTATRATSARSDTTTFSPTLAQLRSGNFKIRVSATHNNSTNSGIFHLDYVDIEVDYTATQTVEASVSFDAAATFSATGAVEHVVAATLAVDAAATFSANGVLEAQGAVTFAAASTFSAVGTVVPAGGGTRTQVQVKTATNSTPFTSIGVTMSPAVTAGNVIVAALACDKSAPNMTPPGSGWNVIINNAGTSVSMWVGWKVADGGETTLTWTHDAGTDAAGDTLWVAEYSDTGSGSWTDLGSTSNPSDNSTVTVESTGTTSATTAVGEALAFFAIDSSSSSTGTSYNNSFSEILAFQSSGRGGLAIAHVSDLAASTTAECTQTHTGTADQMSAAILVLAKPGGAATVQASASFSAASTMSASGFVTRAATLSVTAASTFTAVGFATRPATLSVAAASTFTAAGVVTVPATLSVVAASMMTLAAFVQRFATLSLTAASTFTAVGTVIPAAGITVTFELYESGNFIATLGTHEMTPAEGDHLMSFDLQPYLASLSDNTGSGIELRVSAGAGIHIEAAEWRSWFLAPQGAQTIQATVTFTSASTFTVTAFVTEFGTASFVAASTFTVVGVIEKQVTVAFAAAAFFTATGLVTEQATLALSAASTFTVVGVRERPATVTYAAASTFTAVAVPVKVALLSVDASATFTATGLVTTWATVTYNAVATFVAVGTTEGEVAASLSCAAAATFTVTAWVFRPATVTYAAASTFTTTAFVVLGASVTYTAAATFTVVGGVVVAASVTYAASATFTAVGVRERPATVTYVSAATFTAVGTRERPASVTYTAASTFVATAYVIALATVTFDAVATLTLVGTATLFATLTYAAVSTFVAVATVTPQIQYPDQATPVRMFLFGGPVSLRSERKVTEVDAKYGVRTPDSRGGVR